MDFVHLHLAMADHDELCATCSKVDLYSLFTGPRYFPGDGYGNRANVELGTLEEVKANINCPLCRLVKHDIYGDDHRHPWPAHGNEEDASKIRCSVSPIRADYGGGISYENSATQDLIATILCVELSPSADCPETEADRIRMYGRGPGIQLLSPDSVDPNRPLHNGFLMTDVEASLALVSKWLTSCKGCHQATCRSEDNRRPVLQIIKVIDVIKRQVIEKPLSSISYAALSYVWGRDQTAYAQLRNELTMEKDSEGNAFMPLPLQIPETINDAIQVCKALSIPYLWVDLYCIDQHDPTQQAMEISLMGEIYRRSDITLVDTNASHLDAPGIAKGGESGLFPKPGDDQVVPKQRVEEIHGHKYISALPSLLDQIHASDWHTRSWTMQEGELATRVALFGGYDVSFICGAGHWRQSLHSGKYGHEAEMPGLDLFSEGYYLLCGLSWLRTPEWSFADYDTILTAYSGRNITVESDKLSAISGCLNMIARKKGVEFFAGLPSRDFHYAVLWLGEYDRPRDGFPSWSWAGWHALQQRHIVYPMKGSSGEIPQSVGGNSDNDDLRSPEDIELQGLLISLTERPHAFNRCSQHLAHLSISENHQAITITSESAHFFIDILAGAAGPPEPLVLDHTQTRIPKTMDSTLGFEIQSGLTATTPETEFSTPFERLRLRDDSGNTNIYHYPRWFNHWPPLKLNLPLKLRISTLIWLLENGIRLIKVVGIKLLEGDDGLQPFDLVLCLGIDDRGQSPGRGRRLGMFCIPKAVWDSAGPTEMTVELL